MLLCLRYELEGSSGPLSQADELAERALDGRGHLLR